MGESFGGEGERGEEVGRVEDGDVREVVVFSDERERGGQRGGGRG